MAMDRNKFIKVLEAKGAVITKHKNYTCCEFPSAEKDNIFFSVWVYPDGECTLATQLKEDRDVNLAYMQFEEVDYPSIEELLLALLNIVENILQLGIKVESEIGLFFQSFTAKYGNGEIAFSNSYFKFGNFRLPKIRGLVGSIEIQNA